MGTRGENKVMIKEYKTVTNYRGMTRKMATIICDGCKKEFDVPENEADRG